MVSIIIPVYNSELYLKECLDSVINQTYSDIEILIIDDGSTDSSSDICDYYSSIDERIIVYHTENRGVSSARNFAISKAKGEYISFIDSDDVVDIYFIEYLLSICEKNDLDIGFCDSLSFEGDFKNINNNPKLNLPVNCFDSQYALENYYDTWINPVIWNKLIKKELLTDLYFPNIKRAEDFWMVIQLILRAKKSVEQRA